MEVGPGAAALIVELGAQTAIVEGKRTELPPIEFSLLAELASRPGVLIPHKELSDVAFGAGVPMTLQDLHWRISRMRKLVGERDRQVKWIENRRGQGYLLDLPAFAVQVVDRAPSPSPVGGPSQETAQDAAEPAILPAAQPEPTATETLDQVPGPREREVEATTPPLRKSSRFRPRVVLVAALVGCTALTSTWAAGYLLASGSEDDSPFVSGSLPSQLPSTAVPEVKGDEKKRPAKPKGQGEAKSKERKVRRPSGNDDAAAPIVVADVPESFDSEPPTNSSSHDGDSKAENRDKDPGDQQSAAAPALPPAPTRLLYHLVHKKTGDHFVTTDSAAASEHEAMGYEGGPIAQVYGEQEENTKAITTNAGSAYIFASATPKTEPSSRTVALWYATDGQGDFFYSTSRSEAEGQGWSSTIVGYVRPL